MHLLIIIFISINCNFVSSSEYPDTKELEGATKLTLIEDIDVYDIENSTLRLVIHVNKEEHVQTNYLVLFENKNTLLVQDIKDAVFMKVFEYLVIYISGLSPNTTYQFCIVDKGRGIIFKSPIVTTKKASQEPEKPDKNLFYVTFVKNELIFTTKYRLHRQNTEVWYRVVLVEVKGENEKNIEENDLKENTNFIKFCKVVSGHSYKFKVKACNKYECSNQVVTKNYVAGSFKRGVEVINVTKTTCNISWKSQRKNYNNYLIQVFNTEGRNIKNLSINTPYIRALFTIDGLHPGNIYLISVSVGNLQESPYEEVECGTLPVERKPDNANITLFTISFDYGVAKVKLNDNSRFENCAQYYKVFFYKHEVYDTHIEYFITCKEYEIKPYYFEVGIYNVVIHACNKIGCSEEVISRDYEIVKRKKPAPLSYKILDTKKKSCTIQWIKQNPNISLIREETIYNFPYGDYTINFIVIGSDDNALNFLTAKDACIAQHSKFLPAVPKQDEFDFSFSENIATVKLRNNTNKNCEIKYKISLWYLISPYSDPDQVSLHCNDKQVNIYLSFNSDYKFKVKACSDEGCSSAMTSSLYTTFKQTSKLIGPKGPLEVLNVTDNTCEIQWTKPSNNTENVQYYIKYYIKDNSLSEIAKNFVTSSSKPSTSIDKLEPRSKYIVMVGVVKNKKMSLEMVQGECYTKNLREWNDAQKISIRHYDIKESKVQFMIPLKKNEFKQNEIKVYVKEGKDIFLYTDTNDFNSSELVEYVILDVFRLKPDTMYRFRVVEKSRGLYFESNDVRTLDKTSERTEKIKIYKVELHTIWLTIPLKNNEFMESNFVVNVKKENKSAIMSAISVVYVQTENTLVIIVSGLSPNTTYEFEVVQRNKDVTYNIIKVKTSPGVSKKPKENMFYISFEKNEAIITRKQHYHWEEMGTWYRIQLLKVEGNTENLIETAVLDANTNSNHFTNLTQGHKYKFRINAHNVTGISDSIDTREYIAGNYERPIEVLNSTDTTCTILWKKPKSKTKYMDNYIQIIDKSDMNIKTHFMIASPGKPLQIIGLYPENQYAFAVSTIEAKLTPFVETECRTTPFKVAVNLKKPSANSFNISFEYGVVQIQFINYLIYEDCKKIYNVFIHKKEEPSVSVVYDQITCKKYKVGPYYFEPGTYFIMIQACRENSKCSAFLRSKEYTIEKLKEPIPLSYKVLQTSEHSCTIEWVKRRNISDIHVETIWFSKNSINDGDKINFVVIGTDNQPFNIHLANDACIAHRRIATPAKPKESDLNIKLTSVDPLLLNQENVTTVKFHKSNNNNCELWYIIKMCTLSSYCYDRKILKCYKDLNIAYTVKTGVYYFIINACNKNGCSQPMKTKMYINYNPSDKLCKPEGPIQILKFTSTSCKIEWELPKNISSCQEYDNVNASTSPFVMYYIHFYIQDRPSFDVFKIYQHPVTSKKPSYILEGLHPGSNYNIVVGVLRDNNKSTKSISTECHTLHS